MVIPTIQMSKSAQNSLGTRMVTGFHCLGITYQKIQLNSQYYL